MSPTVSQIRIRSENDENAAHNPCVKSRASLSPMYKIKCYGNQLVCKLDDTIMLYFENVNGLPT